uniref:Retrotransposon gag domain-containing protein n=1 Tax=Acrobeloides nanus TaxID=290746 RepID=A0A914CWV1_9BILA
MAEEIIDSLDGLKTTLIAIDAKLNHSNTPQYSCPLYDGSYPIENWVPLWNKMVNFYGWPVETALKKLPAFLILKASDALNSLDENQKSVYKTCMDTLAEKLKFPDNTEKMRDQLNNRKQGKNESVSEYLNSIKKLVRSSYPSSRFTDANSIKLITIESFIKGLRPEFKAQVKRELKGKAPENLEDLVKIADAEELVQMSLNSSNESDAKLQQTLEMTQDIAKKVDQVTSKMNQMNMVAAIPTPSSDGNHREQRSSDGRSRERGVFNYSDVSNRGQPYDPNRYANIYRGQPDGPNRGPSSVKDGWNGYDESLSENDCQDFDEYDHSDENDFQYDGKYGYDAWGDEENDPYEDGYYSDGYVCNMPDDGDY